MDKLTPTKILTLEQKKERHLKNKKELEIYIQTEIIKLLPEKKYFSTFKI